MSSHIIFMKEIFYPNRLIKAREKLGITMTEASRRLNMSPIGYSRYEHGERIPSPQTIEVIARCFGTSSDYLYGKTEDMSPDYVIVYEKDNKPLFDLVVECSDAEAETIKRLSAYYREISSSKK